MIDEDPSKNQAIELRRNGKSLRQIREVMGLRTDRSLSEWLRGEPPPDWTRRPNAKDDLRARAVELRRQGKSYRTICAELGVAKSSVSPWVRDIELTPDQADLVDNTVQGARARAAATTRANRVRRVAHIKDVARAEIPPLTESELFVAGVVAYWAEGSKAKPWNSGPEVSFINSDPLLISLFVRFLDLIGVERQRVRYRVQIDEMADVDAAEQFWVAALRIEREELLPTTLKQHNPRAAKKYEGMHYYGCVTVRVRRSTDLNRQIAGWFAGIAG